MLESTRRPLYVHAACLAALLVTLPGSARTEEAPPAGATQSERRFGLWRLGPVYVTPRFEINNIGIDTNVFLTRADRERDVTARGGPGLELVLPIRSSLRLVGLGNIDYLYFARQEDQRRLTGHAGGGAEVETGLLYARGLRVYSSTFDRPAYEVDARIKQQSWQTILDARLKGGTHRLGLTASFYGTRYDLTEGQSFLGSDLRSNLARDEYRFVAGVGYALTSKTTLQVGGDYQQDRFLISTDRNSDSNRVYGGVRVTSDTLLSGSLLGGLRFFRPQAAGRDGTTVPFAAVEIGYRLPRTFVQAAYARDLRLSALDHRDGSFTFESEVVAARLEKDLIGRLSLWIHGRLTRSLGNDGVVVHTAAGEQVVDRNETLREGTVDLGYGFPWKLRLGIAASYRDRQSPIRQFGVEGLIVGLSVHYLGGPSVTYRP